MNSALKFPQQGSFSVVTPVYNCEASVAELRRRLDEVLPRIATTGRFQCAVRFFKLDFHDTGSACFRHADRVQHSAIAACDFHQVYLNLFGIWHAHLCLCSVSRGGNRAGISILRLTGMIPGVLRNSKAMFKIHGFY